MKTEKAWPTVPRMNRADKLLLLQKLGSPLTSGKASGSPSFWPAAAAVECRPVLADDPQLGCS